MNAQASNSNKRKLYLVEPDDEVLRLFLLGRGHQAMRNYIRASADAGWPRPNMRFLLEAIYSRFGQIVRGGASIDSLLRLRRILQEVLAESDGASAEFKLRMGSISDLITDYVNQEGGADGNAIFHDRLVVRLIDALKANEEVEESALIGVVGDRGAFIQAITTLIVADLVRFTDHEDSLTYSLSSRGRSRLEARQKDDPLRPLSSTPPDLIIWTPVQPIFDLLILPFAQHVIDRPELQTQAATKFLSDFGIEVDPALMERPLEEWYNSDEAFLVPISRRREADDKGIYGAITLPRVRLSPVASETSVDVAVGSAFCGFHLLAHRPVLEKLRGFPKGIPAFPADPDEIRDAVPWGAFGQWLQSNGVKARILGDRATREFFAAVLPFSEGTKGNVQLVSVESNSRRLDQLQDSEEGVITLAVATGPLLAIARSANLVVVTTSLSILNSAREQGLSYRRASELVFKQYVFLGISRARFESDENAEDSVYRVMLFVEAAYRLIKSEQRLFAEYCAAQWKELGKQFQGRSEFTTDFTILDIEFAIEASYRWLGHDPMKLQSRDDWPSDAAGMRDCTFWTQEEKDAVHWPSITQRRIEAEARVDALGREVVRMLGPYEGDLKDVVAQKCQYLKRIGCLRQAEKALKAVIDNLAVRGSEG